MIHASQLVHVNENTHHKEAFLHCEGATVSARKESSWQKLISSPGTHLRANVFQVATIARSTL